MRASLAGVALLAALVLPAVASGVHTPNDRTWKPVVVALRTVGRAPAARLSEARIAALQQQVLDRLGPDDFRLTARWRAVPGFAGRASPVGLAKLRADPHVARADYDAPGRGG